MSSEKNLYVRSRCGRGFTFKSLNDGATLKDQSDRQWIRSLAIPPAWTKVVVDLSRSAKIHVTGRDNKNRKQYIYNPSYRKRREKAKFDRIVEFASKLTTMRRATGQYLNDPSPSREKVLSCMVRLLDHAYFRPGNPHYVEENNTYGLTTLRSKHLEISGTTLEFDYTGKSGKHQHRVVEDSQLAKVVNQLDEMPGYRIFKYLDHEGNKVFVTPEDLNGFIKDLMGQQFSAKDFRTWAGTYLAATLLNEYGSSTDSKKVQINIVRAIDSVAKKLGNTRAVAKANYIDPRILEQYSTGRTIQPIIEELSSAILEKELVSLEELAVLKMLKDIVS